MFMLEPHSLIAVILIGLVAGWLAAKIVQGSGLGIIGDIIVGIIGAYIGRWLLISQLHVHIPGGPITRDIISATIGAIVLLLLIRLIRRI
jgi:uncharacterized membrane protein YeaQ/YmgE (transglycosylase-associated protein family)